jgi:hypothetical protein
MFRGCEQVGIQFEARAQIDVRGGAERVALVLRQDVLRLALAGSLLHHVEQHRLQFGPGEARREPLERGRSDVLHDPAAVVHQDSITHRLSFGQGVPAPGAEAPAEVAWLGRRGGLESQKAPLAVCAVLSPRTPPAISTPSPAGGPLGSERRWPWTRQPTSLQVVNEHLAATASRRRHGERRIPIDPATFRAARHPGAPSGIPVRPSGKRFPRSGIWVPGSGTPVRGFGIQFRGSGTLGRAPASSSRSPASLGWSPATPGGAPAPGCRTARSVCRSTSSACLCAVSASPRTPETADKALDNIDSS